MSELEDAERASGGRVTVTSRLEMLEKDVRNHAKTITDITQKLGSALSDIDGIQSWKMEQMIAGVRDEEREKALYERLDRMSTEFATGIRRVAEDVAGVKGVAVKIAWIAAVPIIGAAITGIALVLVFGLKLGSGIH